MKPLPARSDMEGNQLIPQATAAFTVRLEVIADEITKDALSIRQHFNGRGLPFCSDAVWKIFQRVDNGIVEMGKAASEAARFAYEAGHHRFSDRLESELLDAFESNFTLGFQKLSAVRVGETQRIIDGLSNRQMLENDGHLQVAQRSKVNGQLELRQYFQALKRARKRWFDHIPFVARLAMWLFKPH